MVLKTTEKPHQLTRRVCLGSKNVNHRNAGSGRIPLDERDTLGKGDDPRVRDIEFTEDIRSVPRQPGKDALRSRLSRARP